MARRPSVFQAPDEDEEEDYEQWLEIKGRGAPQDSSAGWGSRWGGQGAVRRLICVRGRASGAPAWLRGSNLLTSPGRGYPRGAHINHQDGAKNHMVTPGSLCRGCGFPRARILGLFYAR